MPPIVAFQKPFVFFFARGVGRGGSLEGDLILLGV